VPLLIDALQPARIVLRLSRNVAQVAGHHGLLDGQNLHGTDASPSVVFREDGLGFESDVVRGQKTGFFLDQRGNRREVGRMAAGGRVLNVFSFSGGFSVHAARGGAVAVTDVDISPHALASARRNMALNAGHPSVARSRHEQVQADAFRWLEAAPRGAWDLVILDPPSMAKREPERSGAIEAYGRLARLGAACVAPGGRLLAASCSAHVTTDEFLAATRAALRGSGTAWTEERVAGHEADHPAEFPEAQYLKALQARRSS
jgi:23S rRNA (cytosine1962-C5)-methyltransferase